MKFFFFVNSKNQPVVQGSSGRLVSGKSQLSIPIKEASATGIGEGGVVRWGGGGLTMEAVEGVNSSDVRCIRFL